ncbi:hypothetical protein NLG97_g2243 [Lecanicillium saksenae]|uniref:Uncharacterized protein n=1 Tax=Lecanicillium saksenae TaxID=468837 RepID=A0ACC1R2Q1_9HYPO|nr:hypothetical protein NLG97_g2243 [Lecanicillium saksenae]
MHFHALQIASLISSAVALQSRDGRGFKLTDEKSLQSSNLNPTCKGVLLQPIACDENVADLGDRRYHGSLGDEDVMDSVCSASCERALGTARRRIQGACRSTPDLMPGYPVLSLIDSIIAGWNETCLKDASGAYCNGKYQTCHQISTRSLTQYLDVIDALDDKYEDIDDMPENELCKTCYASKLNMMRDSPYSAYEELFANMLAQVNKKCNIDTPTDPITPTLPANETTSCDKPEDLYESQDGDTCDSIALTQSVSAATLYFNNPRLLNCSSIPSGTSLCLPGRCKVQKVTEADADCITFATSVGVSWQTLIRWNMALDTACSNLWNTRAPFWGHVVCVTQPGGEYKPNTNGTDMSTPGNGNIGGQGGNGDGYADSWTAPPRDGKVADKTTDMCGKYIQADEGLRCAQIVSKRATPLDVFLQANPSLGKTEVECDEKLKVGTWYCLNPMRPVTA